MDKEIYDWVGGGLVFGIWLYIVVSGIRAFIQGRKNGLSPFMTASEIRQDPALAQEALKWKRKIRKLFLLWIVTVAIFFILSNDDPEYDRI